MLNDLTKESIHGFLLSFYFLILSYNSIKCNNMYKSFGSPKIAELFLILLKQLTALFKSIRLIYMYVLATKDVPCYC